MWLVGKPRDKKSFAFTGKQINLPRYNWHYRCIWQKNKSVKSAQCDFLLSTSLDAAICNPMCAQSTVFINQRHNTVNRTPLSRQFSQPFGFWQKTPRTLLPIGLLQCNSVSVRISPLLDAVFEIFFVSCMVLVSWRMLLCSLLVRCIDNFNAVGDLRHLSQHDAGRTVFLVR